MTTPRQTACAIVATLVAFSVTLSYALIVPFFPEDAARRGATELETGLILAIYALASLLSSSAYGKHIVSIGPKGMYVAGVACMGCCTILFGLLEYCPPGKTFVAMCLTVRFFQGISSSAVSISLFAITATEFPDKVSTMIGLYESSGGLAFIVGPTAGGILYEIGGFGLPLYVVGAFTVFAALLCYLLLPSQFPVDESQSSTFAYTALLKIPETWLSIFSILANTTSVSFLDLTMAIFLDKFALQPIQKGLVFAIISVFYAITTPLWGKIADKGGWSRHLMMLGAFANGCGYLLVGPSPLLHCSSTLWLACTALVFIGIGMPAQVIPPFRDILQLAKNHNFPDDTHTYGLVSGIINTCFPLGAFIGPSVGGFLVQILKFPWTTTLVAFLNIMVGATLLANIIYANMWKRQNKQDNTQYTMIQ